MTDEQLLQLLIQISTDLPAMTLPGDASSAPSMSTTSVTIQTVPTLPSAPALPTVPTIPGGGF